MQSLQTEANMSFHINKVYLVLIIVFFKKLTFSESFFLK